MHEELITYKGVSQVSGVLVSNPQILLVEIRVHAECGAGRDAALRSSEEASARIREFLIGQGIGEARMRMVPMGCTAPLRSPEVTAADRAANRRIEVVVLEVGDPTQK
jgi:outer membrane protein OmpA-like peptidoglycan-associated protein